MPRERYSSSQIFSAQDLPSPLLQVYLLFRPIAQALSSCFQPFLQSSAVSRVNSAPPIDVSFSLFRPQRRVLANLTMSPIVSRHCQFHIPTRPLQPQGQICHSPGHISIRVLHIIIPIKVERHHLEKPLRPRRRYRSRQSTRFYL